MPQRGLMWSSLAGADAGVQIFASGWRRAWLRPERNLLQHSESVPPCYRSFVHPARQRAIEHLRSALLEFDERSGAILGVQEKHLLPVRPNIRITITQDMGARAYELLARGPNVLNL